MQCRGADPNPKDERAAARTIMNSEIPEEINRLAETLASTVCLLQFHKEQHYFSLSITSWEECIYCAWQTLESMLPECADQIVHDWDHEKLTVIPESSSKEPICWLVVCLCYVHPSSSPTKAVHQLSEFCSAELYCDSKWLHPTFVGSASFLCSGWIYGTLWMWLTFWLSEASC